MSIKKIILVFVGGSLGSICRFCVGLFVNILSVSYFFVPTFIVNMLGCFIIGLLIGKINLSKDLNLLLMTGFCGGFTTFSTFSRESLFLIQEGRPVLALAYNVVSILFGLLLLYFGYLITNKKAAIS